MDTALVEKIVRFRLGCWADEHQVAKFDDVLEFATNDKSAGTVAAYNASQRRFYPINDYHKRLARDNEFWYLSELRYGSDMRVANFCTYLDDLNVRGNVLMNYTDAAFWDFNSRPDGAAGYPIFQFARRETDKSSVLFPLDHAFMGIGSRNIPHSTDDFDIPFDEKIDKAVWRGKLTGVSRDDRGHFHVEKICSSLIAAKSDEEVFEIIDRYASFGRIRICLLYRENPEIDVGLIGPEPLWFPTVESYAGARALKTLSAPMLLIKDQLRYKYIISISGNDYASGLYWALMSNSVVLSTPLAWKTALDWGLEAWEHFVPIGADLLDIPEKIQWCRDHRAEIQAINLRAKLYINTVVNKELRDIADEAVVRAYETRINDEPRARPLSYASDSRLSIARVISPG